jgi:dipeptidyl aminopeptidase/acylaminoacyl peptidase
MTLSSIRVLVTLAVFAIAATEAQAQKQPLSHEALYLMKRVGAPSLSPDGKWVVFSVTEPSYETNQSVSDLWIVPSDASARPRRLTNTRAGESDVTWSADSRRIAFSARRDGDEVNQIYVMEMSGGEARRVTTISTGARSPQFSPDGSRLLFTSQVYPGALDDEANKKAAREERERKYRVRVYDGFPVRLWDRWRDDKQVHLFVQHVDSAAGARDILAGTGLVKQPGFSVPVAEGSRQDIRAAWSPDGASIVFAASTAMNTAAYAEVDTHLYRIGAGGGEPVRMTSKTGSYGSPAFSAQGGTLYASFEPSNGKVYNLTRIVGFDWPSMANERVVSQGDQSVGAFVVASDGKTLYFTAEDEGLVKIFAVPANGGTPTVAANPGRGAYGGLQSAERAPVVVASWGSSINPSEVVRVDLASKAHRNLTDFAVADAGKIDWESPRHFTFTSKRGRPIHNFIVLPAGFDSTKKYPLFVLIHGGAHNMWTDAISLRWNYHLLARPGYVMLMTNYTGSTGFGAEFAQNIQGDPLRGPAEELVEGADEAIKRFSFIDPTRQVAGGASYGGHLANALQAWSGTRFKALISHAGLASLESQWATSDVIYHRELQSLGPVWEQGDVWKTHSPARYAADFKTPMLLSIGERDYRVPLNNTLEMWSLLQRRQIPSRLLVWPDENHWILNPENSRVFYKEVESWLARWVKPGAQ